MDLLSQRIQLPDGRVLGFAEYGRPTGVPLFYLHGWPSSRLEPMAMHETCVELGIRLIAPDRPGMGISDFHRGRTIPNFGNDVSRLADHFNFGRFAVLGMSGGGPYAAACASLLPNRVTQAILVCSVGPADSPEATKGMVAINRWLLGMARRFPRVAQCVAGVCLRAIWRKGNQVLPKQIELSLPPADRKTLQSESLRKVLTDASLEALRNGVRGAAADGLLYGRDWGFALQNIRVPVWLWHGEADVIVPPTMGHYLAETIPGCRARFLPEDGHFSLPYTRLKEILEKVVLVER